jgi:carbamoyltransferase
MIVLGLNAFHADSAAAIVREGKLIAAAEEERFRRVKHWAGFPTQAIEYCLREARVDLGDVDHVVVNQDNRANFFRKLGYMLSHQPDPGLIIARWRNRQHRAGVLDLLSGAFPGKRVHAKLHRIEHHLAHLSSCFHVSPFEEAVTLSVDGFGDFSSAAWGFGTGSDLSVAQRIYFPHSLGVFYQALTQYLGFPHYGDEYKVMGLAPYGKPFHLGAMRKLVGLLPDGSFRLDLRYFRHHRSQISYEWNGGAPQFSDLFDPALEELLGPRRKPSEALEQRHHDIARSVQAMYEEAFFHLIRAAHERYSSTNLVLAGGCALNSVANGKVRRVTTYRRVYVQSAAGDAGGAVGAAFALWHKLGGKRTFVMDHAYWGPDFTRDEIANVLSEHGRDLSGVGCTIEQVPDETDLCRRTGAAIADGKVVGWFQGRMEWGPRALGNRSILCDPRRADMKTILNAKIKRRESFRPFAPSILEDAVSEWFEENDAVPFMMQVFQIRKEKRKLIPAVTHVDGSGRLQTVSESANPLYHRLIKTFGEITGIPMVLNTSFNENEPIVCKPQEALDCFLRTQMDVLVLGDTMITRKKPPIVPGGLLLADNHQECQR